MGFKLKQFNIGDRVEVVGARIVGKVSYSLDDVTYAVEFPYRPDTRPGNVVMNFRLPELRAADEEE